MDKFMHRLVEKHLLMKGFSRFFANNMVDWYYEDFFQVKSPLKKKIWAHKRGFMSYKVDYYHLTEDNFQDFLSDDDYYRMHPINGPFSHWIDDKLTIRYILYPFAEYLPGYYYHLYDGEILRLADCPESYGASADSLVQLLEEKRILAAKEMIGSHGLQFYKLVYNGNEYAVNDRVMPKETFLSMLKTWLDSPGSGYLVTEYLKPCEVFSRIWDQTANTLRLVVIRNKNQSAAVVDSFIRFGTKATGSVESTTLGGVTCRVNIVDGHFGDAKIFENRKILDCPYHPDTKVFIEGYVPHWDEILSKIIEISNYIPHIIYMGYDVVVTDDGFKIIEINSHQGIGFNQSHTPFLKNDLTKDFFNAQLNRIRQEDENRKSMKAYNRFIRFLKKTKHQLSLLFKKKRL